MQRGFPALKKVVIAFVLLGLNGCALYYSKPVTNAVNAGRLKIGMSPQEVHKVVGAADEVSKRKLDENNSREVWTYYEYGPNVRGCSLAALSCFPDMFVPFKAKTQYVIFHNDEVIGWNLPDPFARGIEIDDRNL